MSIHNSYRNFPSYLLDIDHLIGLWEKSTKVVAWYPHPGNVRGPFGRWFNITPVDPQYEKHVASASDDAEYAAAAMNAVPYLIQEIESLRMELATHGIRTFSDEYTLR